MTKIRTLAGAVPRGRSRRRLAPERVKRLHVQVDVDTYAWLSSVAGDNGIGWALDTIAEIHRIIEGLEALNGNPGSGMVN